MPGSVNKMGCGQLLLLAAVIVGGLALAAEAPVFVVVIAVVVAVYLLWRLVRAKEVSTVAGVLERDLRIEAESRGLSLAEYRRMLEARAQLEALEQLQAEREAERDAQSEREPRYARRRDEPEPDSDPDPESEPEINEDWIAEGRCGYCRSRRLRHVGDTIVCRNCGKSYAQ